MKVTMTVDCTPEEARSFFGLPDIKPVQDAMLKEMEDRLRASLQAMDPQELVRTWLPAGLQGFDQLQKLFWSSIAGAARATGKSGTSDGATNKE